jgi:hypothetical protein
MANGVHTLLGTIAQEEHWPLFKPLPISIGIYDIGLNRSYWSQGTIEKGCVDLHATGIEHRTEQGIVGQFVAQQHWHAEQFQRWNGYQFQVATKTQTLGHRHTDAQTRIAAWAAAHGHCIERDGMAIGERHGLVDHCAQPFGSTPFL